MDPDSTLPSGVKRRPSPDFRAELPPLSPEESAAWIAEVMAEPPPPSFWQKFVESAKFVAGVAFLLAVLCFAWPVIKPIIGIRPVKDPAVARADAEELVRMFKERQAIQKAVFKRWVRESHQDGKLARALDLIRRMHSDLRSRHQINSQVEMLVGDMTYQELLESGLEDGKIWDSGRWNEYVDQVAPQMLEIFGKIRTE